jgi:hypothetical protein
VWGGAGPTYHLGRLATAELLLEPRRGVEAAERVGEAEREQQCGAGPTYHLGRLATAELLLEPRRGVEAAERVGEAEREQQCGVGQAPRTTWAASPRLSCCWSRAEGAARLGARALACSAGSTRSPSYLPGHGVG